MDLVEGSHSARSRRGRRLATLLVILVLVGLSLYLWPVRGGVQGLSNASALSAPRDPRSAAAVAQLPADVWDGLMGHRDGPAGPKRPGNLTRISPHEDGGPGGNGSLDRNAGDGTTLPALGAGSMTTMLSDGGAGPGSGTPPEQSSTSPLLGAGPEASPSGDGPGGRGGNPGNGGFSAFPGHLGPFAADDNPGGNPGFAPPIFTTDPSPNDPPVPTPEPSTVILVGSNLALLGALAWRYVHERQERKPSG